MEAATQDLIARLREHASHQVGDAFRLCRDTAAALESMVADAKRYKRLRDGNEWPAVFADCHAPEPLRGGDLDKALDQ